MLLHNASDAAPLKIHLLDMGTERYGDCILVRRGSRTILIDGGHPGDFQRRGNSPGIPAQLQKILGHPAPFAVDLLVVTHCHSDHIGCLPTLVDNGDLQAEWALVADEKLGFGRAMDFVPPDSPSPADRLAAALREEDHSDLPDAELAVFLQDAANLEQRYNTMLDQLEQSGTHVVRYGRDPHAPVETAFQDFGLKVLGPTRQHLVLCAEAIARFTDMATDQMAGVTDSSEATIASLYRSLVPTADAPEGAEDRPGKGAALNDQSIVLKLKVGQASAMLAADMQFAKAEVSGLNPLMTALRGKVKNAGPYKFIKLTHHSSYNGMDESLLNEWSATRTFAHTGGLNDATHPDPGVLQLLEEHTNEITWARTDRNGLIGVAFTQTGANLTISKGELNDPTPNGDTVQPSGPEEQAETEIPETPAPAVTISRSASGVTEVSASAKLSPDVTRLTVTFEIDRQARSSKARTDPPPPPPRPQPSAAIPPTLQFAAGRKLPSLLFVTHAARLANNIGTQEAQAVLRAIRAAGQTVYEVQNPSNPFTEIRTQLKKPYVGVVILGGYDVLPAQRLDSLPPSLRQKVGNHAGDADNFIIWNDEIYGDRDGDTLPEIPVSRIPDARSPRLVYAALSAAVPAVANTRFGIRNIARPFAKDAFLILPGNQALLVSKPTDPAQVGQGNASGAHVYHMLHGSDVDATRFWGENGGGVYEAINISNVPTSFSGVVLAGCCWGALTVQTTAANATPGQQPAARTPASAIALSYLHAGARAFIGCTGTHYSPTVAPYHYFGGPMHTAFWKRYTQGAAPAEALFSAKLDYLQRIPHGQTTPNGQAIEFKILKQFTCLGLGW